MRGGYASLSNRAGDLSPQVSAVTHRIATTICAFYTITIVAFWLLSKVAIRLVGTSTLDQVMLVLGLGRKQGCSRVHLVRLGVQ